MTTLTADEEVTCDAVVIGTGAGGAVMAKELAERGHAVLMVEEGDYYSRKAFNGRAVENMRRFYRDSGATGSVGNCVIPIPMGRLVGGSTAINTGTCWRTPDWVLQKWSDAGLTDLAPERMGPYFERVERELQVAPADPKYLGGVADVIARGCDVLGYSHRPLNRNAPGCDGAERLRLRLPDGGQAQHRRVLRARRPAPGGDALHRRARRADPRRGRQGRRHRGKVDRHRPSPARGRQRR